MFSLDPIFQWATARTLFKAWSSQNSSILLKRKSKVKVTIFFFFLDGLLRIDVPPFSVLIYWYLGILMFVLLSLESAVFLPLIYPDFTFSGRPSLFCPAFSDYLNDEISEELAPILPSPILTLSFKFLSSSSSLTASELCLTSELIVSSVYNVSS